MKKVSLEKLFEKPLSGEWGIEDSGKGIATPVIRTANFLNSGKLNLDNIVYREIDKTKYDSKLLKFGDIIIEKSGGSPNQPVGRVVYFDIVEKEYFTNNFTSILRPKSDNNSKYVFYLMRHLYDTRKVLKFQNQTTGIINLKLSDYLKQTVVKLSSNINEQNKIVNILDKLDNKILLRQEQLKELSNVIKSRFYELFGDPVLNEKGWEKQSLFNLTLKIGSGATPKGGRESYVSEGTSFIRSMNVYDNQFLYKDLVYLTDEQANKLDNVIVECNDVLLNITGASLARSCIVPQAIIPARVNQHVAIVRSKKEVLSPVFLNQLLINAEFKRALLEMGENNGATRQALTKNQIENLTVILPPLTLQNQFADFVAEVDKSQLAIKKSLEELETLKKSLMQAYFG